MGNYKQINQAILKDNTQEVIEEVKKYLKVVETTQRSNNINALTCWGWGRGKALTQTIESNGW